MTESEYIWCCDVCGIAVPDDSDFPVNSIERQEIKRIVDEHDFSNYHWMGSFKMESLTHTEPEFVDYCEKCGIAVQCSDILLFNMKTMKFHKSPALDSALWHRNAIHRPRSKCKGRVIHTMVIE